MSKKNIFSYPKNIFSYPKSMKNNLMMMKKLRGQIITLMDTKKQVLRIINYLTFQRSRVCQEK